MNGEVIVPNTSGIDMMFPRHAADKYGVCPFKEITSAVKNKITGTRCAQSCMLFNHEEGDCNINVIANRLKRDDLMPAQYIGELNSETTKSNEDR